MMAAQKYDLVVQKNFLTVIEQAIFIFCECVVFVVVMQVYRQTGYHCPPRP